MMDRLATLSTMILVISLVGTASTASALTWETCVGQALEGNADLAAARADVERAQADLRQVASFGRPQLEASVSVYPDRNGDYFRSYAFDPDEEGNYIAVLKGGQLLFDAGSQDHEVARALQVLEVVQQRYRAASAEVRYKLCCEFINLLESLEREAILDRTLKRRQDTLRRVRLRYDSGHENLGSVLTAEAREMEAAFDVRQAPRREQTIRRRLAGLLGSVPSDDAALPQVEGTREPAQAPKEEPDYERLVDDNPLVRQLAASAEALRKATRAAQADRFPALSAHAGLAVRDTGDEVENEWFGGLRMSIPLFSGGGLSARIDRAKVQTRKAEILEGASRQDTIAALKSKRQAWKDAWDRRAIAKKHFEAAGERARIGWAQYEAGTLVSDLWLPIEDRLVRAERDLLQARVQILRAETQWIHAIGGSLEDEHE